MTDACLGQTLVRLWVALAQEEVCPRCLGELDTGSECNDCGFDAMPYARGGGPEEAAGPG